MDFIVGQVYHRRNDIHVKYGGQRQSGISPSRSVDAIFIFTGEAGENYGYRDEFRPDGTFWYSGEGRVGDMEFSRGNLALRDHEKNGKRVLLFEYVRKGQVRYVGTARYLGHHEEDRPDQNREIRRAIVFELEVDSSDRSPRVQQSRREVASDSFGRMWTRDLDELRQLARGRPSTTAPRRELRAVTSGRSRAVKIYVRRRANGICEGCGSLAPFLDKKKRPFLVPHHIHRYSDNGPDDPRWVIALCPNCHDEVHYGKEGDRLNRSLAEKMMTLEP